MNNIYPSDVSQEDRNKGKSDIIFHITGIENISQLPFFIMEYQKDTNGHDIWIIKQYKKKEKYIRCYAERIGYTSRDGICEFYFRDINEKLYGGNFYHGKHQRFIFKFSSEMYYNPNSNNSDENIFINSRRLLFNKDEQNIIDLYNKLFGSS